LAKGQFFEISTPTLSLPPITAFRPEEIWQTIPHVPKKRCWVGQTNLYAFVLLIGSRPEKFRIIFTEHHCRDL